MDGGGWRWGARARLQGGRVPLGPHTPLDAPWMHCSRTSQQAAAAATARQPSLDPPVCVCFLRAQHLGSLLAAPDTEVVAVALQALLSFLKKTHHAHIRWQGYKDLNARLNVLAQGWGGKEEVGMGKGSGGGWPMLRLLCTTQACLWRGG